MKGGGWASDPLVRNAYKKWGGPTKVRGAYKGSVSEELKEVGKGVGRLIVSCIPGALGRVIVMLSVDYRSRNTLSQNNPNKEKMMY